jgi:predicted Zn-dependent protease
MNRRDFLWFSGIATGSVTFPTMFSGCAFDPITGEAMISLVSEEQEIAIDQAQSPHQFSADYGSNSDARLNNYVSHVGKSIAEASHRPQMPYNYRVLDANHINAYTFPGGSMAVTRGILVELESEAELAALLGHEIGHVNARHSAERSTKGMLAQAAVGIASSAVGNENVQQVVSGIGMISATALLAKYSRDNEREADQLGMDYSVKAGANPKGMVALMNMLNSLHASSPNALEIMFSSHPMSDERLKNANAQMNSDYRTQLSRNIGREPYMDYTADLRQQKPFIKALANADLSISAGKFDDASREINRARAMQEDDYGLWVISAKNEIGKENHRAAISHLNKAAALKPSEHLPTYMLGASYLETGQPEQALAMFTRYKRDLPGNPTVDFFIGFSHEKQGQKSAAAESYKVYLRQVQQGAQAEYAYGKLIEWGYTS